MKRDFLGILDFDTCQKGPAPAERRGAGAEPRLCPLDLPQFYIKIARMCESIWRWLDPVAPRPL